MTIHQLLALTDLTANDEIPVWDEDASGEPTKKITAQNFAAAVKTLASLLGTGDVVNDLTSSAIDKPLSAAMGKALNEKIKSTTVDITTSSAGVSGLLSNSKIVYAIVCNTANVYPMFVPFIGTNGTTYVMVFDYSTTALTKLVNTQLNVTVYYQDLPA